MILFGHLGLTYVAARGAEKYINKDTHKTFKVDYRLLFLGSILPDLIDKSIIFFISNETLKSGRIIGHTFIFNLLLFLIGIASFRKKRGIGILVITFGCFMHLILDFMWNYLDILFWPFYGYSFSKENLKLDKWIQYILSVFKKDNPVFSFTSIKDRLFSNPISGFSELAGLIIIVYFVGMLIKFKQTNSFLKYGRFNFKERKNEL